MGKKNPKLDFQCFVASSLKNLINIKARKNIICIDFGFEVCILFGKLYFFLDVSIKGRVGLQTPTVYRTGPYLVHFKRL